MTTTQTRTASAALVRSFRERLNIAGSEADHAAIADDISTFLRQPGAWLLTPSQLRNLNRMRTAAMRKSAGQSAR
jgi:hypothetical protein